uniref:Arrestin C-terminal-like domain-containing protein n=1 Tax=Acrobeloides nanus TaxID=290746 RepID=A0A914EDF0_9BILA
MAKTNIQIFYDSSTNVYANGQLVRGYVILELEKEMKARAVVLYMIGKADTHWTRKRGNSTDTIKDTEACMNNKTILWNDSTNEILLKGTHRYDFSFNLPLNCPPSFEGTFGHIRYYVKVNIDIPWKFDKKEISAFSVIPCFDLNTIPSSINSAMMESMKNIGFICKNGSICARVAIPKMGYVPGETIWAQIEVNNTSSCDIEGIEASLMELSRFHGRHSGYSVSKTHSRLVAKSRKEVNIQEKQTLTERISLQIPLIAPSFNNCRIIQVDYQLEVEIDAHGFFNDNKIEIPILIGTYPLKNIPIDTPANPTIVPDHDPPPTYGESIFGAKKMVHEDEDAKHFINFKPKYRSFPLASSTMRPIIFPQGSMIENSKSDGCVIS